MTLLKLNSIDLKEDMVEKHFDKNGDTGSSVDSITNIKMREKSLNTRRQLISQMRKRQTKVRLRTLSIPQTSSYR